LGRYTFRAHLRQFQFSKNSWIANDRALIESNFQKVCDFQDHFQQKLYMGEFGICYHAKNKPRSAWIKDVLAFANRNRIDWCYWTYKEMDFGLVNVDNDIISQEVLDTLRAGCVG